MEKINLGYSTKNIPISSHHQYLECLTNKTGLFIKRLRWKVLYLDKPAKNNLGKTKFFGFKTQKCPLQSIALNDFKHDLYEMVQNIKFRPVRNAFLDQLSQDLKSIRPSQEVLVAADKTTNIYKMEVEHY